MKGKQRWGYLMILLAALGAGLCLFGYVGLAALADAGIRGPYEHIPRERMWGLARSVVVDPGRWQEIVRAVPSDDYGVFAALGSAVLARSSSNRRRRAARTRCRRGRWTPRWPERGSCATARMPTQGRSAAVSRVAQFASSMWPRVSSRR